MGRIVDITGETSGYLTVVCKSNKRDSTNKILWECKCRCGNVVYLRTSEITLQIRKSCGCASSFFKSESSKKHGSYKDKLYKVWSNMKNRCYNPNSTSYPNYGERGITICEEWKNSFELFKKWALENGYEEHLSIDRINVNGHYEPENCKWSTTAEQSRNTRRNRLITKDGITKTLTDWCKELDITTAGVYKRINEGFPEKYWLLPPNELKKKKYRGVKND